MYPSVRRRYHFRLQPTDTRAMSSCGCQLSQMVFSLYIRLGSCEFIDELGNGVSSWCAETDGVYKL